MEKIEYIRTMETDSGAVLLIFRVLRDCNMSEVQLVFEHENSFRFPKLQVSCGDFVWVTNMASEEMEQITSNNSSQTRTLILQIIDDKINLLDFKRLEEL